MISSLWLVVTIGAVFAVFLWTVRNDPHPGAGQQTGWFRIADPTQGIPTADRGPERPRGRAGQRTPGSRRDRSGAGKLPETDNRPARSSRIRDRARTGRRQASDDRPTKAR